MNLKDRPPKKLVDLQTIGARFEKIELHPTYMDFIDGPSDVRPPNERSVKSSGSIHNRPIQQPNTLPDSKFSHKYFDDKR